MSNYTNDYEGLSEEQRHSLVSTYANQLLARYTEQQLKELAFDVLYEYAMERVLRGEKLDESQWSDLES